MNSFSASSPPVVVSDLTLTRVVFEYILIIISCRTYKNLTLTRVVFEFSLDFLLRRVLSDLTLTRVVFEYSRSSAKKE